MNAFAQILADKSIQLDRARTEILQLNVGKLCNLTCSHCHVNAGPARKEIITRETLDRILDWLEQTDIPMVDLTGGAPEMIPDFRYLIERLGKMTPRRHIIDRCNLTILLEPGYSDLIGFLAAHHVEIIASMPCYSPENVNAQRGEGVFDASIEALKQLNQAGYGVDPALPLHLVYNPLGAKLPGNQAELEDDYKRELKDHFGIVFNRLFTITNMPVSRFASWLRHQNAYQQYMDLLRTSFNAGTIEGLMCRNTLNVDWQGSMYDCDFNQQLGMTLGEKPGLRVWDLQPGMLSQILIRTGAHCFGCTAGSGSSCGGALA